MWDYDHFYGLVDPTSPRSKVGRSSRAWRWWSEGPGGLPGQLGDLSQSGDAGEDGRHGRSHIRRPTRIRYRRRVARGRASRLGIEFPEPGTCRDARRGAHRHPATVDRGLGQIRGRFFTLEDAHCDPKPLQRPHPPIVVGAKSRKCYESTARHAEEWNMPSTAPHEWRSPTVASMRQAPNWGAILHRFVDLFSCSCIQPSRTKSASNSTASPSTRALVASMWCCPFTNRPTKRSSDIAPTLSSGSFARVSLCGAVGAFIAVRLHIVVLLVVSLRNSFGRYLFLGDPGIRRTSRRRRRGRR